MSLSKFDLNILSSYVKNWQNQCFWSTMLLQHFIGNLNKINNLKFVENYIVDLCISLDDERMNNKRE